MQTLPLILFISILSQPTAAQDACEDIERAVKAGSLAAKELEVGDCVGGLEHDALERLVTLTIRYRQEPIAIELYQAAKGDLTKTISLAAAYELPGLVATILDRDPALLNKVGIEDRTPLEWAAAGGAYTTAKLLLERGANKLEEAMLAAVQEDRLAVAYLLEAEIDDWTSSAAKAKVLGAAAQNADEVFLQHLLSRGFDPDVKDSDSYYPILYATQHADSNVGKRNWFFLASHGANESLPICAVTREEFDHIREMAPEWVASKFSEIYPTCARDD